MINKSEQFEPKLQELATFVEILSHLVRIQISQELVKKNSCTFLLLILFHILAAKNAK